MLLSLSKSKNLQYLRVLGNIPLSEENVSSAYPSGVPGELSPILKEIKVIKDKIRDDEESASWEITHIAGNQQIIISIFN